MKTNLKTFPAVAIPCPYCSTTNQCETWKEDFEAELREMYKFPELVAFGYPVVTIKEILGE